MKKYLLITILIFILIPSGLFAQTNLVSVTFQVLLNDPIGSDTVFISGNHEKLGNWYPDSIFLVQESAHLWLREFFLPIGARIEFKFTRGSWKKEAIYDSIYVIPGNHTLLVRTDTVFSALVTAWKDNPKWSTTTGDIRYHKNISGFNLKPRDLTVWLPPDYDSAPDRRYPVLYMHDGQNMFDRQEATFNTEWRLDETADSLIAINRMESLIIVGIYNTPDRRHEYTDSDTGRIYMRLVSEIIKPFIDKIYRTRPEREFTATGGSSAGGLISFMLIWEHPEIFSRAACISPSFKIASIDYVKKVLNTPRDQFNRFIYIDNGNTGLESRLLPGIYEMIAVLNKKGYVQGRDFEWYLAQNAEHTENDWAKRSWRFLRYLFPDQ